MKLKNEKIKQDIDLLLKKSDVARGGSQRVIYNASKKGFVEASAAMMFVAPPDEFGAGIC